MPAIFYKHISKRKEDEYKQVNYISRNFFKETLVWAI